MYRLKIADIAKEDVEKIVQLEKEFKFHIMAFEPGYQFAQPTTDQLEKLQELEKDLGVMLLAYMPE